MIGDPLLLSVFLISTALSSPPSTRPFNPSPSAFWSLCSAPASWRRCHRDAAMDEVKDEAGCEGQTGSLDFLFVIGLRVVGGRTSA